MHDNYRDRLKSIVFLYLCTTALLMAWCNPPETRAQKSTVVIRPCVTLEVCATKGAGLEPEHANPNDENGKPQTESKYSESDIEELAKLTIAEAGNQSELGKRLVIDTVLNRVDHPNFPGTVHGVITQKNQFSTYTSGRIYRYQATEDVRRLIAEEIDRRTDSAVVFFRAGSYGPYGVPLYKVGGHYFSSYD